ncbi:MAG: bifunctional UDP-3-O-[3-hydroxymyristoyl] N-acetylglucosamine deacetylase/3-hydroxyacyl-ACP dehydratase [Candidatus Hydrogenedentota bacterium]
MISSELQCFSEEVYAIQRTIKKEVEFKGKGLHTGTDTRVVLKPAKPNTGIIFIRKDLPEEPVIEAIGNNVVDSDRGTVLGASSVKIRTVEHLLSVCAGLFIDNLYIDVYGEEIPAFDGSAKELVDEIIKVGFDDEHIAKQIYRLKEPIFMKEGESLLIALPSNELTVQMTIQHNKTTNILQYKNIKITEENFIKEIAPARTYGFFEEIEELRSRGLIKGGELSNAIVITKDGIMNKEGLRFEDEFVRHKILDLLGDLKLLGADICANIIGIKSGHKLNLKFVKKILRLYQIDASQYLKIPDIGEEQLDIKEIKKILPHRYPFLLVDRILSIDGDEKIIGVKNVTINEEFFQGHFPNYPIMPGVLIVEAMAQVGGVLLLSKKENAGKIVFFMGLDNVKFRRPVVPGDQIIFEVVKIKLKAKTGVMHGSAYVNGQLAAEADLKYSIVDE